MSSGDGGVPVTSKSRVGAVLLCLFLGGLGVHRFYLGMVSGVFHLVLWMAGSFMVVLGVTGVLRVTAVGTVCYVALGVWAIVDLIRIAMGRLGDTR